MARTPPDHRRWEPTVRGRRRRQRLRIALVVTSTLICGGCTVGAIVIGPCFFDPPPGDVGQLTVDNDTNVTVSVADCDASDTCWAPVDLPRVRPGDTTTLVVESCDADTLGVFHPGTPLPFLCVTEPTERDDGSLPPVRLSAAHQCP